jgi:hypothetical protein
LSGGEGGGGQVADEAEATAAEVGGEFGAEEFVVGKAVEGERGDELGAAAFDAEPDPFVQGREGAAFGDGQDSGTVGCDTKELEAAGKAFEDDGGVVAVVLGGEGKAGLGESNLETQVVEAEADRGGKVVLFAGGQGEAAFTAKEAGLRGGEIVGESHAAPLAGRGGEGGEIERGHVGLRNREGGEQATG